MNRFQAGDSEIWALADEIVKMHNELYHRGQDCPAEDEDGTCAIFSGKPAVLHWTAEGLIRSADASRRTPDATSK